jgi:hypothetical protein
MWYAPVSVRIPPEMFGLFPGYEKVTMERMVNGDRKSVLGPLSGKIIRVY